MILSSLQLTYRGKNFKDLCVMCLVMIETWTQYCTNKHHGGTSGNISKCMGTRMAFFSPSYSYLNHTQLTSISKRIFYLKQVSLKLGNIK